MSVSRESEITSVEELLAVQKKEKKELIAKTQKKKHSVPKGDKKKKKEVTAEIAQMLADLDSKHEKEMEDFEKSLISKEKSESLKTNVKDAEATTSKVLDAKSSTETKIGVTKEEGIKNKVITEEGDVTKEEGVKNKVITEEGDVTEEDVKKKVITEEGDVTKEEDVKKKVITEEGDVTKEEDIKNKVITQEGVAHSLNSSRVKCPILTEGNVIPKEEIAAEGDDIIKEESVTKEKVLTEEKKITEVECTAKRKISESPAESPEKQNVQVPRISKAQRRRNKKSLLEKERNRAIAEQDIENLKGLRHIESVEIINKLSQRKLTIYEIPSDGNCLYKAVEHQLSVLKLKETTVQALRQQTSEYMLMHMQDYIPFLTSPETGDMLTEKQYAQYCEDIAKTPSWGGHVEIQVMSHILGYPIEVVQAQGPSIFSGDEKNSPKLILSYHRHAYGLGEHYNSVIPIIGK